MMVGKAAWNTYVECTVKAFARTKDGWGAYMAAIANYAGETKYKEIHKKNMKSLQNIKWNGSNYPMENHIANHRQASDDILKYS